MKPWRWIDRRALLLLHADSLALHGGAPGLRDEGLLDAALARPLQRAAFGEPDLAELAACYGVALARCRAFVDGRRRAALLAVAVFLGLNGARLVAPPADITATLVAVADGRLDEAGFAAWLRERIQVRP